MITVIRRDPQRWRRGAVSISRNMHDVPTAATLVRLLRASYPFSRCPKRAPTRTHRVARTAWRGW